MKIKERFANYLLNSAIGQETINKQVASIVNRRLPRIPAWRTGQPLWNPWSTQAAIKHGLKASVWVYACLRKIAITASSIPWIVEEKKGDKWERIEGHPLEILLKEPNPSMTGQDLFERLTYHLYLGGNGVWHKIFVQRMPVELWPLDPDKIKPVPGNKTGMLDSYQYKISPGNPPIIVPPDEIAHFMFIDPSNIYWGLAPIQAAAKVIDTDVEAVNWNKVSMQNRCIPDGVFSFKHPLTDDQWVEAKRQISEQHQGGDNARTPWVTGSDAEWKQMSLTPAEMDFINSRKWSVYEICAVFNMDPLNIGVPDSSSRANKKEARRGLWEDTTIPYLNDIKAGLNLDLIRYWDPASVKPRVEAKIRINYDLSNVSALKELIFEKVRTALGFYKMRIPVNMINQRLELGFDDIPGGDEPPSAATDVLIEESPKNQLPFFQNKALSEEEMNIYWKSFESDREKWDIQTQKLVAKQLKAEEEAVLKGFKRVGKAGAILGINSQITNWVALFKAIYETSIEFFGIQEFNRLNKEKMQHKAFDVFEKVVQAWILKYSAIEISEISTTSKDKISALIATGLQDGKTNIEIAKEIKEQYVRWYNPAAETGIDLSRAATIARTEINAASGFGNQQGAVQISKELDLIIIKTWISSRDSRVRDEHRSIDGQTRPLDKPFSNGLMYNGDPAGSAKERINCRCAVKQTVKRGA